MAEDQTRVVYSSMSTIMYFEVVSEYTSEVLRSIRMSNNYDAMRMVSDDRGTQASMHLCLWLTK